MLIGSFPAQNLVDTRDKCVSGPMQRVADKRTRQRTDTSKIDDGHPQRLRVDKKVVWLDVTMNHHQRLIRDIDC